MVSKSVWGPCVWYLFHTLAYKAVPSNFNEIKDELIQYIQRICKIESNKVLAVCIAFADA